jgi:hypothetical protein
MEALRMSLDIFTNPTDIAYVVATALVIVLLAKSLRKFGDKISAKRQKAEPEA